MVLDMAVGQAGRDSDFRRRRRRQCGQKQPPSTHPTTNLDIPGIRQQIGYTEPFEKQFPQEIAVATKHVDKDQETVFLAPDWLKYLDSYKGKTPGVLYKGFPMVEDVVFVKHPNYWTRIDNHGKLIANGQCYWIALALLLYGDASCWLRVKAEHLNFLEEILVNPQHPRHKFYAWENQARTLTQATGTAQAWSGVVSLWEKLQIPGC